MVEKSIIKQIIKTKMLEDIPRKRILIPIISEYVFFSGENFVMCQKLWLIIKAITKHKFLQIYSKYVIKEEKLYRKFSITWLVHAGYAEEHDAKEENSSSASLTMGQIQKYV